MTTLSDRIAAEHSSRWRDRGGTVECRCGQRFNTSTDQHAHEAHVADVTERAVRDTIATQFENLEHTRAMTQAAIRDGVTIQWVEGFDAAAHTAARIAREGTTP